ncbi:TetR/AcrR family transcriptional regulator [Desulfobacter curvatus]|uniref:TetR/AcrR family transcriptional regulator n=1 Tax=Desulfobacter curvatus TaxID=2290 RepID=UPI000379E4D2|nr:TetR family transcriptional regulator [Desulfobacter curvatus]
MKISQEQKKENRLKLIRAMTDLVIENEGPVTMREVARRAGVADATIYNYFPTKEAIFFAYYEDHVNDVIDQLMAMDTFHTFSLQEQLQTLFDTSLRLYLPDREFVAATFKKVWLAGSGNFARFKAVRSGLLAAVNDIIAAAEEAGEIPGQVFQDLTGQFFADAYIAVVLYWLADGSDKFKNTDVLMDQGLDLACALLKAGVANKLFDMAVFLFKQHVLTRLSRFSPIEKADIKPKRRFMGGQNDE